MKVYCVFEFRRHEVDDLRAIFHDKLMAEGYAEKANSNIIDGTDPYYWHFYVSEWEVL